MLTNLTRILQYVRSYMYGCLSKNPKVGVHVRIRRACVADRTYTALHIDFFFLPLIVREFVIGHVIFQYMVPPEKIYILIRSPTDSSQMFVKHFASIMSIWSIRQCDSRSSLVEGCCFRDTFLPSENHV